MKSKQIPLVVALALAIGSMASGCTRDAPSSEAAHSGTLEPAAGAQEPVDTHDADHAAAHDADHAAAHDADHAAAVAHARGNDFPVPENHAPWTPDAPLIEGMSRVRTAIGALQAQDAAQPDAASVIARADDVDAAIRYMFANCELDTEPDIALHAVLARLMAGSQALRAQPGDTTPVADMHAAVRNYEQLFDDPARGADAT